MSEASKAFWADYDDDEPVVEVMYVRELQAALAARDARRCDVCLHWREFTDMGLGVGDCDATRRFCITNQLHSDSTFSCSYWTARVEKL